MSFSAPVVRTSAILNIPATSDNRELAAPRSMVSTVATRYWERASSVSPSTPTALAAVDASFDTMSPRGARTISIHDLHVEPGRTPDVEHTLAADELIVRTRIPTQSAYRASTYQKIRDRASYAFALASAAVALDIQGDLVRDARIAIGGVATRPWRARDAEQSLIGRRLDERAARHAGELAYVNAHTTPQNAFRVPLGIAAVERALMIARERA
jgi:xanthine dehydrogenase YagS FAD-binding subunit